MRISIFETNSSSVHAFAHLDDEAFRQWSECGGYIDLRKASEEGYAFLSMYDDDPISAYLGSGREPVDVSADMIGHAEIGSVRKSLPDESYYLHPDDCLLEAGILPFNACARETGRRGDPSREWASHCGGLTYIDYAPDEQRGGYDVIAEWYAW